MHSSVVLTEHLHLPQAQKMGPQYVNLDFVEQLIPHNNKVCESICFRRKAI